MPFRQARAQHVAPLKRPPYKGASRPVVATEEPVFLVREVNYWMPSEDPSSVKQSASAAKARQVTNQATLALELPFLVVGTVALGAALGYFLDHWLHTKPILTFVFGGLGFIGGIRELIRRVGSGT